MKVSIIEELHLTHAGHYESISEAERTALRLLKEERSLGQGAARRRRKWPITLSPDLAQFLVVLMRKAQQPKSMVFFDYRYHIRVKMRFPFAPKANYKRNKGILFF